MSLRSQGVVKNIIPAIASTNALISATCVNEAFKLMSYASRSLNNYFMYMGNEGVYSHTFAYQRSKDCCACHVPRREWTLASSTTVQELIDRLKEAPDLCVCLASHASNGRSRWCLQVPQSNSFVFDSRLGSQLNNPSLTAPSTNVWLPKPPALRKATECVLTLLPVSCHLCPVRAVFAQIRHHMPHSH